MEKGYIRVISATSDKVQPVSFAHITISKTVAAEIVFEHSFVTDEDGYSQAVLVDTPNKSLSLDKQNTEIPYATYDIVAEAKGFLPFEMYGVEVFSGETSLVTINFLPATNSGLYRSASAPFDIEPHGLFDDSGGSGLPPISECPTLKVLQVPIIPRLITVHLDKPNVAARNVEVSFRDYIKNVASSEVYPTWPVQCLRANIFSQISIALNRVYTEWYISKGYTFHITGSASYDQKYSYGRNIFENISRLVDEIFNIYIIRPGFIEPYFAQYCDGKTISCSGLSQWGSKDLAERGYSDISILRYYFGNSVQLHTSSLIEDVPESYPGSALRRGSSGTSVQIMQRWLNRIAKDYPSFGQISPVDGVFGAGTETVVKKFQKQFSLVQDGIVGKSTWYKISLTYVAVKKLSQLTSEGEKPDGIAPAGTYGGVSLKIGSSGDKVQEMQFYLQQIAVYNKSIPAITPDGRFGNGTNSAVIAFQKYYKLTQDGIVGKITWDKIYTEYKSIGEDISPPTQIYPSKYPGTAMRQGSRGEEVKTFQSWLAIISYNYSAVPKITADGIFGAGTNTAVRAFQQYFKLTVDGVVGKNTWDKIYEMYTDVSNRAVPANTLPGEYSGVPLQQGSSGPDVTEMQYYLHLLSDYYSSIPSIEYTGFFGAETTEAVRAFQRQSELDPDGIIDNVTYDRIYSDHIQLQTIDGPVNSYNISGYPGYNLVFGNTGENVVKIQFWLNYLGLFFEDITSPPIDGIFGRNTLQSVFEFQVEVNLDVTGEVDEATWNALIINYKTAVATYGEPAYNYGDYHIMTTYPGNILKIGSLGPDVEELQKHMISIASRYCTPFFVPENGLFEASTEQAVKQFQQELQIPVTGIVDKNTWDLIFSIVLT